MVATDASEFGGDVVYISTDQDVAAVAAAAHAPAPGNTPGVCREVPPGFPTDPWASATIVACPWQRDEHINVLEMRAVLLGLF